MLKDSNFNTETEKGSKNYETPDVKLRDFIKCVIKIGAFCLERLKERKDYMGWNVSAL